MTEKQQWAVNCDCSVKLSQSKLAEAKTNLVQGLEKLRAEWTQTEAKLKFEVLRAEIELARDESYLQLAKANLERGFET